MSETATNATTDAAALTAAVRELADELRVRREETWKRYMGAEGAASQALWQGKFEGIEEGANRLRAVLDAADTTALDRSKAEAWDEGYRAGHPESPCSLHPADNPYRTGADQ